MNAVFESQAADNIIRKHKKRHTRPYGCTYTACLKRFGSKNDWKRHENTRHYQIEAWRCQEPSARSKINQCAKVFYRRELYQAHLKDHHGIGDDTEIRKRSQENRIGRNGQSGFWCGFCRMIVTLKTRGLEAWDERFNHIDREHFNNEETIDHWYPLDKDLPVGEILPSDSINTGLSPVDGEHDSDGEDTSDEIDQDNSQTLDAGEEPPVPLLSTSKRTRRVVAGEERSSKRQARERVWYCVSQPLRTIADYTDQSQCTCKDGPHCAALLGFCTSCHQPRCSTCVTQIRSQDSNDRPSPVAT